MKKKVLILSVGALSLKLYGFDPISNSMEIIKTGNQSQAIDFLTETEPDVILFDPQHLGEGGTMGISLFNEIKTKIKNPKFIFFSSITIEELLEAGFPQSIRDNYIKKPAMGIRTIQSKIKEFLLIN